MINARITFSNIQALDVSVEGVTSLSEDSGRSSVAIDDAVFAAPRAYEQLGAGAGTENTMAHRMYTGGGGGDETGHQVILPAFILQLLSTQARNSCFILENVSALNTCRP